jgi:CspA family cold shock protein
MAERRQGHIKNLVRDRGFGFIRDLTGKEYFFHRSSCYGAYDLMEQGETVEFTPEKSDKGPRAIDVARV